MRRTSATRIVPAGALPQQRARKGPSCPSPAWTSRRAIRGDAPRDRRNAQRLGHCAADRCVDGIRDQPRVTSTFRLLRARGATEDSRRARSQRRPATSIRIFVQADVSRSAYESYLPGVSCRNADHGYSGSDSYCTAWLRRRWSSERPFVGRRYRFSYRAPSPDVRNAMPTYPLALVSVDVGATCPATQTSIVPSCESMPSTNASVPMCRVIFPAVDATSFSALRPR